MTSRFLEDEDDIFQRRGLRGDQVPAQWDGMVILVVTATRGSVGLPLCHQASRSEFTELEISGYDAFQFTRDISLLEILLSDMSACYSA